MMTLTDRIDADILARYGMEFVVEASSGGWVAWREYASSSARLVVRIAGAKWEVFTFAENGK